MLVLTCTFPVGEAGKTPFPPMQPFQVAFLPAPEKSHVKELASSFTLSLLGWGRVDMSAVHSIVRIIINLPNAT